MSWGAVIGAGAGLLGSAMSSSGDKNGGAGTQSQSKEPWAPAQPWLMQNLLQGQQLQGQLTAQPFSPQQTAAYDNSYAQSDYMRRLVPSLLGQLQKQPVGFDPANPTAKQTPWNWQGLLAGGDPNLNQRSVLDAKPPPAASTGKKDDPLGDFIQQNGVTSGMNMTSFDGTGNLMGNGGYGSFRYGMPMPKAGTKEYRDMSEYFAMGGVDPNNHYGRGASYVDPNANPLAYMWSSGLAGGAPGEAEGPSSGAPGGAASAGPGGTF